MVANPGYTPPEHVVEQADLSAFQGIYKRRGDKSFDLMLEAIYRYGGDKAVILFAIHVFEYLKETGGRLKEFDEKIRRENQKVL